MVVSYFKVLYLYDLYIYMNDQHKAIPKPTRVSRDYELLITRRLFRSSKNLNPMKVTMSDTICSKTFRSLF